MSECQEQDSVSGAARDSVVVMLRLADRTIASSPERILAALQSEELSRVIRQVLEAEGRRLAEMQNSGQPITNADGARVARTAGEAAGTAVLHNVQQQVESSSAYKDVQTSLRRLEGAFRCSPMGVFVSENSTLLYIVASGLALGGATALYVTRSGDLPAGWATDFAARRLRSIRIGSLEVGTQALRFVPSERVVEVQPFLSVSLWREIRTTFRLNVAFQQDQVQTATGGVDISVPLHRGVTLTGRASGGVQQPLVSGVRTGPLQPTYDLGLGVTIAGPPEAPGLRIRSEIFLQQQDGVQRAGASGQVQYNFGGGLSGQVGASGQYTQPLRGPEPARTEVRVQAGLTFQFN